MVSLDENELIGVIALVLRDIHHNTIVFATSVESGQNMRKDWIHTFWCLQNYFYIVYSHFENPLSEVHIISHGDNWYFSDSSWICFQLKIHEMVIEIKMKMIPIISFSIDAIGMSYIIGSIFKLIFTLINLMAIISDISMWRWQWLKSIYVIPTMVTESMMG